MPELQKPSRKKHFECNIIVLTSAPFQEEKLYYAFHIKMQLFCFRYGFVSQSVHCFWGLALTWILELNCACLYMTCSVYVFLALCPCSCSDRSYLTLIAAGFGLVPTSSTDFYVWNSTVVTFMRITYLRFNILFPVLGYDDVSETNLRSYSVHSAKHVQDNRPVPIRRKRSIGKKTAICTWGAKPGGACGQPSRTFHWENVTCTKEKRPFLVPALLFAQNKPLPEKLSSGGCP